MVGSMNDDQIKGVLLVDFARIYHANRNLPWEKYLTEGDLELVQGKIMPSSWYPFSVLERIGYAVFMLVGKGDLKNAWAFGAFTMHDTYRKIYQNVLFDKIDPAEVIKKFIVLRKQFIKFRQPGFDVLKLEMTGENQAMITFKLPQNGNYIEPYTHQIAGGMEKLLELSGARDVQVDIKRIQSDTESASEIELKWKPQ